MTISRMRSRLIGFGFALLLIISEAPVVAAQAAPDEAVRTLAGFNYKEKVENAASDATGLPLIVALHWSGSSPAEFAPYVSGFKSPVRILLVEGPYDHPRGGHSFYVREPKSYYDLSPDERMQNLLQEAEKLSKFIKAAVETYSPNTKPVVIGASQGGDISYVIAIRYGDLISHAFPLLATVDERIITKYATAKKKARVDVYHGLNDPIVTADTAAGHIAALRKAGYKARFHKYPGAKHDIPPTMKADYIAEISKVLF